MFRLPQGLKPRSVADGESARAEALAYLEAKTTRHWMARWTAATMVCLLAVVMLGATPGSRFDKLGHEMMCACGCGQILLECNHVGCPDSDRMIGELRQQIASGGTDAAVLNWFVAKYGPPILAAPIRGGFDNVAWITPMAVFVLATIGVAILVVLWKRRGGGGGGDRGSGGGMVAVGDATDSAAVDAVRERIRRETEY